MRVLITADAIGGVWPYAIDLAQGLAAHGVEPVLALTGPAPDAPAEAAGVRTIDTGLPLDWLADSETALRAAARRMAEIAGDLGCDVAQLNAPALADARYAMPTIAVVHSCLATWWAAMRDGPLPDDFAWRDRRHRAGLVAATRVAAPSRAFAETTRAAHRLSALPEVVHNGRRTLTTAPAPQADHVFTAGRLWDEGKDVATLDRVAARLSVPFRAAGPLAGPGGAAVGFAHLKPLGRIDEAALSAELAARPVFVSAARYEPFGLAVLEAAQAGCALVLSDIPTFRELWDGAATFVAPGDDAGFARAIEALIADSPARAAAGTRAADRAARYTVAAMAARMAALYADVLPRERVAA